MPIIVVVLGVIIIILGGIFFLTPTDKAEAPLITNQETPTGNRTESMEQAEENPIVNNGENTAPVPEVSGLTLKADGSYLTPARKEHKLSVNLTLDGEVITDAKVIFDDKDGYSNPNQEKFDKAYKSLIIGKNVKEVNLARVGGASLTSTAFNEAVKKIVTQLPS